LRICSIWLQKNRPPRRGVWFQRAAALLQVGPGEAGEGHRVVVQAVRLAQLPVAGKEPLGVGRRALGRAVPADVPRADDGGVLLEQPHPLIGPRGPIVRQSEHDGAAAHRRRLQKPKQVLGGLGLEPAMVEAVTPQGYHRPAAVLQIGRRRGELHLLDEPRPVGLDRVDRLAVEADVVHHRERPARGVGAFAAMAQHGAGALVVPVALIADAGAEALHERAVDAVLLHPLEVAQDGGLDRRAEQLGGRPVSIAIVAGEPLRGREFAQVGPEIDAAPRRLAVDPAPVHPAGRVPIALGHEPALIARHDLAGQRRGVDADLDRPFVGREGHGQGHGHVFGRSGEQEQERAAEQVVNLGSCVGVWSHSSSVAATLLTHCLSTATVRERVGHAPGRSTASDSLPGGRGADGSGAKDRPGDQ